MPCHDRGGGAADAAEMGRDQRGDCLHSMLIPDHETQLDLLNGEAISRTVADLLRHSRQHPLTIGIHGEWGAGKSSILKMIEADLRKDDKIAVLWFNGWTFEGFDDAKMILIETTISELIRRQTKGNKVKSLATKLLKRVNWLKLLKGGSGVALSVLSGFPSPDQLGSANEILNQIVEGVSKFDQNEISAKVNEALGLLRPATPDALPQAIYSFRNDFQKLIDTTGIDQLVILIDDLDRCLPTTAIQTLEAIRLFLFVPKTAFIIGADESMIEYAVRQHFPEFPATSGPLHHSRNYLEKIVQIPFRIPALGRQETRVYVVLLLVQAIVGEDHDGFRELLCKAKTALKQPWIGQGLSQADIHAVDISIRAILDETFIFAQQIAPILAEGTKGNPRQIKRFLNALLVRRAIADARGFHHLIKQPVLGKLMLAERFQPEFYDFIASQAMSTSNGQSGDIIALESSGSTDDQRDKSAGKRHQGVHTDDHNEIKRWRDNEWIVRWLNILPTIGDTDLRPYVFVARDRPLPSNGSGSDSLDMLVQKLCHGRMAVISARSDIKSLSSADAETVFATLRERVLSADNFEIVPPGADGLAEVAKYHSRFQAEVVHLLRSINPKTLGTWAVAGWTDAITEPQSRHDLDAVIQSWADQSENTMLQIAASAALSKSRVTS